MTKKPQKALFIKADLMTPEMAAVPPLGLLHIAKIAQKRQIETQIIDLRLQKPGHIGSILKQALESKPDIVGFSALPQHHRFVSKLAAFVRQHGRSDFLLLGGGPYFSSCTEQALSDGPFDLAVIGEGERTFEQILEHLQGERTLDQVNGIAYRQGAETVFTKPQSPLDTQEIDALYPLPWDLIDLAEYAKFTSYSGRQGSLYAPILTSRGCPFKCLNCYHVMGYQFRTRSAKSVLDEVRHLKSKYGIRRIEVLDETFNLQYDRTMEILEGFAEIGDVTIELSRGLRGDLIDEKMIRALKRANCGIVSIPIETASPRLQKVLNKNVDIEKTLHALKLAKEAGLYTWSYFMVGLPTETREEADATFRLAETAGYDMPIVFILTPHPGTELAKMIDRTPDPHDLNFYYGNYNYFSDAPAEYLYKRRLKLLSKNFLKKKNRFMVWAYYRASLHAARLLGFGTMGSYLVRHGRPRAAYGIAVEQEAFASLEQHGGVLAFPESKRSNQPAEAK